MPTKAKSASAKKATKVQLKVVAKVAAKAKPHAKVAPKKVAPKVAAKTPHASAKPTHKVVKSTIVAKAPVNVKTVHAKNSKPQFTKESMFERLLREKQERHEKHQKQNAQHGHAHDSRMPNNHASFSKFAGPRRRAS